MVQVQFLRKVLLCCFLGLYLSSCKVSIEERWKKEAQSSFTDFRLNESASIMNGVNFKGPILKNRIENFPVDSSSIIYGWYYLNNNDTIWIYCNVDKSLNRETTVHSSANYDDLYKDWDNK